MNSLLNPAGDLGCFKTKFRLTELKHLFSFSFAVKRTSFQNQIPSNGIETRFTRSTKEGKTGFQNQIPSNGIETPCESEVMLLLKEVSKPNSV